jgi:hypothetical protein
MIDFAGKERQLADGSQRSMVLQPESAGFFLHLRCQFLPKARGTGSLLKVGLTIEANPSRKRSTTPPLAERCLCFNGWRSSVCVSFDGSVIASLKLG